MKGRPRKPPERAQGRRHRPILSLVALPLPVAVPAPPADLSPEIAERWAAFWRSDYAQVINWDRDQDALRALYRLYDLRRRLELAGGDVFMTGSTGQPILNPALKQLTTVDAAIHAREQQFGLTPRSAAMLGMQIGGLKQTLDDLNREANERAYGNRSTSRKAKAAR